MKYTIKTLAIILLCQWGLNAQDCCIPQKMRDEYERDVKHLALMRMEQFHSPALNLIEIDSAWQDTIWRALSAIYNSGSEGSNVVFNEYCIHHDIWSTLDYLRIPNQIYVKVDPNTPWHQNWASGNIVTNDVFIDSFLLKYGFDSISLSFASLNIFELYTDQYLNLKPLTDSLGTANGIIFAEPHGFAGGNTRITYQNVNGFSRLDFWYGWDDCLAGCISWYSWSFWVDAFCNLVNYSKGGSSGIPDPPNCNTYGPPDPLIGIAGDAILCQGESTTLSVFGGGAEFQWSTGDSTASIVVSPAITTNYTVTVTSNNGCDYENSIFVMVRSLPNVSLELPRDTFCIDETNIGLTGGLPLGGSFSGNGVSGPVFKPNLAGIGNHLITYTFQDGAGCSNFATQEITVLPGDCISAVEDVSAASIKIRPNPTHGIFEIISKDGAGPFNIQLYNSMGQKVYSGRSESSQVELKDLPQGIYLLEVSNERFVATGKIVVQW